MAKSTYQLRTIHPDIEPGETNTAANIGTGQGLVFKEKTGVEFRLRSLLAGDNVTITNDDNEIVISASGNGGEGAESLNGLSDVTIDSPDVGHVLIRDATDFKNRLLVESDISDLGSYIESVAWGDIGGTLNEQADLQGALNDKADDADLTAHIAEPHPTQTQLDKVDVLNTAVMDTDGTRPNVAFVIWQLATEPTNWVDGDIWIETE